MKASQTRHIVVCFETCIIVTGNIQWEVTLAWSTLRAPYMVRINPKTQSALQRLLAGAATEANKYTKEITSLKQITSCLIVIIVQICSFLELYLQIF